MKKTFSLLALLISTFAFSQVGIGTTSPAPSSVLELNAPNKALLITRVNNTAAIANPVNGMLIYDISLNCIRAYENDAWTGCGLVTLPVVSNLSCAAASFNPSAMNQNTPYNGTMVIPYTGGNGASYKSFSINSTNVTGLTATLQAGDLAIGSGNLTFTISGTPTTGGNAIFALSFGGQSCSVTKAVSNFPASYTQNTTLLAAQHLTNAELPFFFDGRTTFATQEQTANMSNLRLHQDNGDIVQTVVSPAVITGGKIVISWSREEKVTGLGLIVDLKNGAATSQASINTLTNVLPNSTQTANGNDMTLTINVTAATNTIIIKSSQDNDGKDPILMELRVFDNNNVQIPIN